MPTWLRPLINFCISFVCQRLMPITLANVQLPIDAWSSPRLKGQLQLPLVQSCRSRAPYTRTIGRILQWSDLSDALTANAERTTSPRKVSSSLRPWFLGESQVLAVREEGSSSSSTRSTSQSRALQAQREAQATLQPNHATTWGERVPEGRKL